MTFGVEILLNSDQDVLLYYPLNCRIPFSLICIADQPVIYYKK